MAKKFLFFGTVDSKGNFESGCGSDCFGYLDNRLSMENMILDATHRLKGHQFFHPSWNAFAICIGTIMKEKVIRVVKVGE